MKPKAILWVFLLSLSACKSEPFDWRQNFNWSVLNCDQAEDGLFIDSMYSKGNVIDVAVDKEGVKTCKLGTPKSVQWKSVTPEQRSQ